MSAELRTHLEGLIERNIAAGMSPQEARYAALRTFGGVEQIKERCRDQRALIVAEQIWQDFQHSLRALARHRGFTMVAAGTLALGRVTRGIIGRPDPPSDKHTSSMVRLVKPRWAIPSSAGRATTTA